MKVYRITLGFRVLITIFCLGLTIFAIYDLIKGHAATSALERTSMVLVVIFCPLMLCVFSTAKVLIDGEKIELSPRLWRPQVLSWSEVESVVTVFLERGSLRLVPKRYTGKKPLHIELFGMSIDLVRDIIAHVPPETNIYLDTRMKRKLAGQPTLFCPIIGKGHLLTKEQALSLWRHPRVG